MSKQWGHGYYKGIEAAQATHGTLAGLWFHSRHDGDLGWQGQVVRDLENGQFVVQLFEWSMGNPTVQKIVPASEMTAWDFFGTNDAMKEAAERHWDRQGIKPRIDRIPNDPRQVSTRIGDSVQADVGPTFSTGKYRGYVCDACGEEFPHETSRDVHFRRAQRGLGCRANAEHHARSKAT